MSKQILNDTYSLQIPDSFEPMSGEALRELSRGGGDPYRWGARDRERHLMIVALWKRYPVLAAWAADLKSVAKKNEQMTSRVYAGHGYRLLERFSAQAGDEKAEGYRFSYRVEDVTQVMSCYLVKDGRTIYAFLCGGREENAEADLPVFRGIMESLAYE